MQDQYLPSLRVPSTAARAQQWFGGAAQPVASHAAKRTAENLGRTFQEAASAAAAAAAAGNAAADREKAVGKSPEKVAEAAGRATQQSGEDAQMTRSQTADAAAKAANKVGVDFTEGPDKTPVEIAPDGARAAKHAGMSVREAAEAAAAAAAAATAAGKAAADIAEELGSQWLRLDIMLGRLTELAELAKVSLGNFREEITHESRSRNSSGLKSAAVPNF